MLEFIVAAGTILTAVATVALAIMAYYAWKTAKDTLESSRLASEQARRDSIAQTRPYVSAYIVPGLWGLGAWDLRVTNTGKTAARNLRFEFDGAEIEKDQITESILSFMITRRTLAPGASIRLIWRTHLSKAGFETEGKDPEGMPEAGVLRAVYDGPDEQYCEESDILITDSGLWPQPSAGEDNPGMENQDMKRLYRIGQLIVRALSELRH